jgi:hypothetical protein
MIDRDKPPELVDGPDGPRLYVPLHVATDIDGQRIVAPGGSMETGWINSTDGTLITYIRMNSLFNASGLVFLPAPHELRALAVKLTERLITLPAYTRSLDAAMSLVPQGWHVGVLSECDEDDSPYCCLTENAEPCRDASGTGVDMTLALTAAALRARAALIPEGSTR